MLKDAVQQCNLCLGEVLVHLIHITWLALVTHSDGENAKAVNHLMPVPEVISTEEEGNGIRQLLREVSLMVENTLDG